MGNNSLRRPSEVLVRFSLDILPVRASQLREIFWPSCNSDANFLYKGWVASQVLFPLFPLLLTVLWTKLSTWTAFFAAVTLRYNNWSNSAPAYSPGRVYAS